MKNKHPLSELDADMRDHIARETQDNIERGMAPDEARFAALRKFGNVTRVHEDARAVWNRPWLDAIRQDVRYALRTLRKNPAFAAVVVLALGFGIGINTATFSLVNAVLVRPLGFAEPERLVAMYEQTTGMGGAFPFSPPDLLDLQREQQSFDGVAAYLAVPVELSGSGSPVRIDAAKVSANLFSLLGVSPAIGPRLHGGRRSTRRGCRAAELGPLADALRRKPRHHRSDDYRRSPAVHGDRRHAGAPMAFTDGQKQARGNEFNHSVIGRLKRGVSIEDARAELAVLTPRINANYPAAAQRIGFSISLSATPLRDDIAGRVERPLLLLLGAVGLVLLIACANIASLVLSRVASRRRELALRTALGSSRLRLLQLLLTEAAILSAIGGLIGLLSSRLIVSIVPVVVTETLPVIRDISIDIRVMAFTAAIAAGTAIFFALVPMVTVDRENPGASLQEDTARTTAGRRRHWLQSALVVSTVTLACVLLVGAGLFIRSFSALMATDPGFDPARLLTASLALPRSGYNTAASVRSFHDALFARASSLPGVRSAALVTDLPFERYERRTFSAEGVETTTGGPAHTNLSWVYGPYFETLGIQIRSGRVFSDMEGTKPAGVVIVNERLARTFWPREDAVGKRIRWGANVPENRNRWLTIVGVVADVVDGPLGAAPYQHAYEPFSQFPNFILNNVPSSFGRHVKLAARTDVDPLTLAPALRAEIARIDPHLAIESINPMVERMEDVVATERFGTLTLGAFAAASLVLAAVGLYGLLVFGVRERRREIAIRLALGADGPSIVQMVVSQGIKLVLVGLITGVLASFAVARAVGSLLYQTRTYDIVAFSTAPIVLVLTALLACALPAYRAARVDPVATLRTE